jgi:murein DD-endopeptidase MepM/ murein hydrolase activator NlpD
MSGAAVGQACNSRLSGSAGDASADNQGMRYARVAAAPAVAMLVALCGAAPALALVDVPGGVQAPSAAQASGGAHGAPTHASPSVRPVVASLSVPRTARSGRPPRVTLRIAESGVASVEVQVTVVALSTHRAVVVASLGWVRTGRTVTVRWPSGASLAAGAYQVSVSAHDRRGATLLRGAHSSGEASLTVTAPAAPAVATPTPAPPAPAPPSEPGVPTVAQTVADGAIFPVVGPHDFGGPENVFGAPRDGYLHQGQDILTAEGTPVVAPLAGSILTTSYQEGGAGYYAVEQTTISFDFMFAHCEVASLAVSTGQAVSAGQTLCRAGQTGDATAPHLDFEMWVDGWQVAGGYPINPLPYLEAWER